MAQPPSPGERIRQEFESARKEYVAFDRTLDAIASLSFILRDVKEIRDETVLANFRPKLEPTGLDVEPYTPDGLIIQKPSSDFLLELKTSWNEGDVPQIIKYAKSTRYLDSDKPRAFGKRRCNLLGYQNTPGENNLKKLFDAWDSGRFNFPLVIFRYSLEQAVDGDRMQFLSVPYKRNGTCPETHLGRILNSVRGVSVSVSNYKSYRSKFHRANDQVISSYAAVLWWTTYAIHYLSEEQRIEMAERGRLSKPFVIPVERLDQVPTPPDVDVPLNPSDVRRALEFLAQAGLVAFKKRDRVFEVELKEDRYIRLPRAVPTLGGPADSDVSTKILARWATRKVTKPLDLKGKPKKAKSSTSRYRDERTGWLFSSS